MSPKPQAAAPAATPEERARRSALLVVFLVVFIDLLGFGIVLPLLPLDLTEILGPLLGGTSWEPSIGVVVAVVMSSFSAMQFFFAPVWGRVSDRVGRRPILLLGLAGSVVFYALFGVAVALGAEGRAPVHATLLGWALVLIFIARVGAGMAGATIPTAQAVIADSTPPERRARGMALIGAAFGIGFTFGPLLGFASLFLEFEGSADMRIAGLSLAAWLDGAPGFLAAGLSLAALLIGLTRLPETLRPNSTPAGRRHWLDVRSLREVLVTPTVGVLVLTFFLATFAFGGLESTLALANKVLLTGGEVTRQFPTREDLRTTGRKNFLIFAYVGLVLMLVQGLIYRRLVQRVGEVRFLRAGILLMALGMAGAGLVLASRGQLADRGLVWVCALPVLTLAVMGFAFLTPSVQSLISRRSDPAKQGEVLGVNQSAAALARILGPGIGLPLFFLTPSHLWPYLLGLVLLLALYPLTLSIRQE